MSTVSREIRKHAYWLSSEFTFRSMTVVSVTDSSSRLGNPTSLLCSALGVASQPVEFGLLDYRMGEIGISEREQATWFQLLSPRGDGTLYILMVNPIEGFELSR